MLADILSLPRSGDTRKKFGCLQAKQLGHHPAFQHMRQHGGPHESPLCHTKGLASPSQAAWDSPQTHAGIGTLELGQAASCTIGTLFGFHMKEKSIFLPVTEHL